MFINVLFAAFKILDKMLRRCCHSAAAFSSDRRDVGCWSHALYVAGHCTA